MPSFAMLVSLILSEHARTSSSFVSYEVYEVGGCPKKERCAFSRRRWWWQRCWRMHNSFFYFPTKKPLPGVLPRLECNTYTILRALSKAIKPPLPQPTSTTAPPPPNNFPGDWATKTGQNDNHKPFPMLWNTVSFGGTQLHLYSLYLLWSWKIHGKNYLIDVIDVTRLSLFEFKFRSIKPKSKSRSENKNIKRKSATWIKKVEVLQLLVFFYNHW